MLCIILPIDATDYGPPIIDVMNIPVILIVIVPAFWLFQLLGHSGFLVISVIMAFRLFLVIPVYQVNLIKHS
jgi:hypothetical protein